MLAELRFASAAGAAACGLRGAALATGTGLRAPTFGACFLASALRPTPLLEVVFRAISMVSLLPAVVFHEPCTFAHFKRQRAQERGLPMPVVLLFLDGARSCPQSAAWPSRPLCPAWLPKLRTNPFRYQHHEAPLRRDLPQSHAGCSSDFVHADTNQKHHNTNFMQFEETAASAPRRGVGGCLSARKRCVR